MAEQELDKGSEAPQTKDGPAPDKGQAGGKFFENFETAEDLQKAYKELQHKLGEQGNELGSLRQALKAKDQEDKIAAALEKVGTLAKKEEPEIDYAAYEAQLSELMAENPKAATKDLLQTLNAWMVQDRQKTMNAAESRIKDIESKLTGITDIMETMTDDYRENKALIEKLRAEGLSISKAKKVAKEILSALPESRQVASTGVMPTRTTRPEEKKVSAVTEEDIAMWKAEGLPDESIARLKAKYERLAESNKENK